jgi:hypothetical protein
MTTGTDGSDGSEGSDGADRLGGAEDPDDVLDTTDKRSGWHSRPVVLAVVGLVLVITGLVSYRRAHDTPAPSPSSTTSSPPSPSFPSLPSGLSTSAPSVVVRSGEVNDEYLLDVPAQDMAAMLRTAPCRPGCVAHTLYEQSLRRAGAAFAGLRPLAGGTVTNEHGRTILQTVEGRATPDSLVHLLLQRVGGPDEALRVTDSVRHRVGTEVLAVIRNGWRLTATLTVRGADPPTAAATTWLRTAALPR